MLFSHVLVKGNNGVFSREMLGCSAQSAQNHPSAKKCPAVD